MSFAARLEGNCGFVYEDGACLTRDHLQLRTIAENRALVMTACHPYYLSRILRAFFNISTLGSHPFPSFTRFLLPPPHFALNNIFS